MNEISGQVGLETITLTKRICHLKEMEFVWGKGSKKNGEWIINTSKLQF